METGKPIIFQNNRKKKLLGILTAVKNKKSPLEYLRENEKKDYSNLISAIKVPIV